MITNQDKKIAIIGCPGSGKTTVAFKLAEKYNLPLYHLDTYQWLPGWQKVAREEFSQAYHALCDLPKWILEGSAMSLLAYRIEKANVIIFLDIPRSTCIWRVIKRSLLHWNQEILGSPKGCKQRFFSFAFLEFLKWIWHFNARYKATILNLLETANPTKKVYIVQSLDELAL